MDISKKIVEIRESKRIKQTEIAEKLSMDRQNYSRIEKKGKKLTIEQLEGIANALGVTIGEILGIEDNKIKVAGYRIVQSDLEKKVIDLEEKLKDKERIIALLDKEDFGYPFNIIDGFALDIIKHFQHPENNSFLKFLHPFYKEKETYPFCEINDTEKILRSVRYYMNFVSKQSELAKETCVYIGRAEAILDVFQEEDFLLGHREEIVGDHILEKIEEVWQKWADEGIVNE